MSEKNYESHIGEFKNKLTRVEEKALHKIGIFTKAVAQDLAPYDTARLKSSVNYKVVKKDNAVHLGTNVEYAIYQEFGTGIYAEEGRGRTTPWLYKNRKGETVFTRGSKPQPFLRPAVLNNINKINRIVEDMKKEF